MKKEKDKDYERNSNCWYHNVCNLNCSNCIRYIEMSYLVDNSGIPEAKKYPKELEADNKDYNSFVRLAEIKDNIVDFVYNRNNLLIVSEYTGNGKTSWAIKLLLKYFNDIWAGNGFRVRGMFVHVPTLLLKLKNFNEPLSEEYKQNLMECDVVIWDDIASIDISKYDYSQMLSYIDYRLIDNKSNIFTSNKCTLEDFEEALGSKLASRIWNTSEVIRFYGKDRRG